MSIPVLFLDNSFLSNIFSQGTKIGLTILNELKGSYNIQITDVVEEEAILDQSFPKDQAIRQ